mmetsp:Transcript_13014/g.28086  ORF Transcript_13014/g.28086 Transcript_13014/m.28086 type:complete len:686 (+) Transcript_13014:23-2080(+)|eukprot:CAMPEP_0172530362 /NCGR_PEP_ID=MMETSP1067-20121228/4114_1 /TAXON_ID=265564 ORGANISM="Thalassiosira punctigera, Strain Tpunct2005C2" /NCGR_SAMPLE_ID=MMETSP1067 /ASSEMBLY_ACC=CAM_ASM_000444 /LENGTH=685 /DNA_ID=CAMNT_0013314549 /DNA_START=22 /DNA_END=2079 /DNA_ORIENTATION=+
MTNRQWSTEVPQTSRPPSHPFGGRGNVRRSHDPLVSPNLGANGVRTLYEALRRGRDINPLGPCLGYRATSSNSGFATPYVYGSYGECVARVDSLAAGLEKGGENLLHRNDDGMLLLGIYMKNCMEWILAEQAIYCLGGSTVPFYDTLGPDTVRFILEHTGLSCVVSSRLELERLCEAKLTGTCPKFHSVLLVDGVTAEASSLASKAGLKVVSFAKIEALGSQIVPTEGHRHSPPDPLDVATFCYTSGTTGNPKGALMTHSNIMSAAGGFSQAEGFDEFVMLPTDRHLSYLPLPHIFERVVVAQIIASGASVAFFRGDPLLLVEDIVACRPTTFPVVPRVLNKIHDKIAAGMAAKGGMTEKMFNAALEAKKMGLQEGRLTHALWDRILFNKIKKALGLDCVRLMVSGSAPLSPSVMTFFRCMMGVPICEGYGQTEGSAAASCSHPDDIASVGHVGGPHGAVEVVLKDVPEMGYFSTDESHSGEPCQGRGEICIRGPVVFKGYYKDEEKTKEAFDSEGWLCSGDIGLWTIEGQLKIIDRKKNIFKLAQGEYVAAEKIENVINQSLLIGQSFVHGDSFQTYLIAIVVPDEEPTRAWAKENLTSTANAPFSELCKSDKLRREVLSEIRRLSKLNGLHGFETVKAVHLESNIFTPESGLVTPTFKLKRPTLKSFYSKQIDDMYAHPPSKL